MADRSADWLNQALRDLEQAEASMQADRHEWACFAAHQATEKSLEALNMALGQSGPTCPARMSCNRLHRKRLRTGSACWMASTSPPAIRTATRTAPPVNISADCRVSRALFHATAIIEWVRAALAQFRERA